MSDIAESSCGGVTVGENERGKCRQEVAEKQPGHALFIVPILVTFFRQPMLTRVVTQEGQQRALRLARVTLAKAFQLETTVESSPPLSECCGVFVTIRVDGELRGCIGYIETDKPLEEIIPDLTLKAAFEDHRFRHLERLEFERAHIEISILSRPELLAHPEDVQVGTHGLIAEWGHRRGLLLPQVAVHYNWSKDDFLNAVCEKAGLPVASWRDPRVRFYSFTAEVFEEEAVA